MMVMMIMVGSKVLGWSFLCCSCCSHHCVTTASMMMKREYEGGPHDANDYFSFHAGGGLNLISESRETLDGPCESSNNYFYACK